ncbi:hypothetical protein [Sporomusa carbonis]|uniref:hypothetical protein n=1 Tax=Sporomusa carbonis TaxID=3076075 RepID=UPI003C79BB8A
MFYLNAGPPGHKNPGNPDARVHFVHDDITGNFKQEIGDKKDAGDDPNYIGLYPIAIIFLTRTLMADC